MSAGRMRLAWVMALLTAAAGMWFWQSRGDVDNAPSSAARAGLAPASHNTLTAATTSATHAPTSVEEAARLIELGVAGDLRVDMHTRSALDILLASLGPDATPAELDRLEATLNRSMPSEAATQAMALVRRYDGYQRAAAAEAAAQQPPGTPEELKALLDKSMALRRQHFDAATAQALFGAEEAQTRIDLAMNAVQFDPRLSPQEKLVQINALHERAAREAPGPRGDASPAFAEMDQQVAALHQQGATPTQIEQLRSRYLGAEAATSLTESTSQRAQWESRYQAYAQQKKSIASAAPPDLAAQLETALRQHFTEEELVAARAYDRNRTH